MTKRLGWMDAYKDSGLLRQYITERGFASIVLHGGSREQWDNWYFVLRRLSRLTGMHMEDLEKELVEDYKASDYCDCEV